MGVGRGVDVIIKGALTRILNTSLYSSLVSMLSRIGLKIDPPQQPPVQVTKLPTTFFVFLRVPLTHLGRWFAFTIKIPRKFIL